MKMAKYLKKYLKYLIWLFKCFSELYWLPSSFNGFIFDLVNFPEFLTPFQISAHCGNLEKENIVENEHEKYITTSCSFVAGGWGLQHTLIGGADWAQESDTEIEAETKTGEAGERSRAAPEEPIWESQSRKVLLVFYHIAFFICKKATSSLLELTAP